MRIAVAALALAIAAAQQSVPRWRELNQTARQAAQAKDYERLQKVLQELQPLMPGNPRIVYNLAASAARLNQSAVAIALLFDLAAMGQVYDLAADEDFQSIRERPEFAEVLKRMGFAKLPVAKSQPLFALAEPDLIPEDIAYDPKTRRYFISSIRQHKILTQNGRAFANTDWAVLALATDPRQRRLWATTAYAAQCQGCDPQDKGKTALLCYDLDSAKLLRRIDSPVPGQLADMTISSTGGLYLTESIHGAVFHFEPTTSQWTRLDSPGDFPSPQTPALAPDEKILYVPDYLRGIAAIDLATHAVTWLQPAPGIALNGIDGLYLHHGSFLAVQNGSRPPRLIRFSQDLRRQQVLEANTPELGEPTHGVILGNEFHFLANTGWDTFEAAGPKKNGAPPTKSTVRKLRIRD
jgi:hypothetical protein